MAQAGSRIRTTAFFTEKTKNRITVAQGKIQATTGRKLSGPDALEVLVLLGAGGLDQLIDQGADVGPLVEQIKQEAGGLSPTFESTTKEE